LNRQSHVVQAHSGIRRNRKALLSDLGTLVRISKQLPELLKEGSGTSCEEVVDQLVSKAFRIIVRCVKVLDLWNDDFRSSRRPSLASRVTVENNSARPLTPPTDGSSFGAESTSPSKAHFESESKPKEDAGSGIDAENKQTWEPVTSDDGFSTRRPSTTTQTAREQPSRGSGRRPSTSESTSQSQSISRPVSRSTSQATSRPRSIQVQMNRKSASHRISYNGLASPKNVNMVSERLTITHDIFLSYLASFIGRLHLQSRSASELLQTTQQSVVSGRDLLNVVELVWQRDLQRTESLEQAKDMMYARITELALAAREIVMPHYDHENEDGDDIMIPDEGKKLMVAATGCVKAAGECVAKTHLVIERIGDFEWEIENIGLGIISPIIEVATPALIEDSTPTQEVRSVDRSSILMPPPPQPSSRPPPPPLSITTEEKPLPIVPYSPWKENLDSPIADTPSEADQSLKSLLPPLAPTSPFGAPDEYTLPDINPSQGLGKAFRADSIGVASNHTNSTYMSSMRDSEASLVSQTSTRATTPEPMSATSSIVPFPKNLSSTSMALSDLQGPLLEEPEDGEAELMEKTYAHELVFNKDNQISGGSLPALIERLTTHDSTPDAMFVSTFYLTFRLFTTPRDFASALIKRFDYVSAVPHIAAPVRLRVYNVFKGWLESHWRSECDMDALDTVVNFAKYKLGPVLPAAGKRLEGLAQKVTSVDGPLVPRLVSSIGKTNTSISQYISPDTPMPNPAISKSQLNSLKVWKADNTKSPSILDFDPLELARQFTIKESKIYCSILPEELLHGEWMTKSGVSVNVRAMSTISNQLSDLVYDTVLSLEDFKKRAVIIKQWVKIAEQCLQLNNYDSLMAIICAVDSSIIGRLKRTWEVISEKTRKRLEELRKVADVSRNYMVLRKRLENHVPPCLPFVGTYLTDLTFVNEGNPDTRPLVLAQNDDDKTKHVINFDKHVKTAKIIGELQRFQIPYRLHEVPEMQEWINAQVLRVAGAAANQQKHYRRSLILEPRAAPAQKASPPAESHWSNTSSIVAKETSTKGAFDFLSWTKPNTQSGSSTPAAL
jgi:RasGEF domain/RasGEF N-terminal motif